MASKYPTLFCPLVLGLEKCLKNFHHRNGKIKLCYTRPLTWTNTLEHLKEWKINMRFRNWNVRSLYNSDSNTTPAREAAKCKLNSGVLQVRQDNGGTETAENYTLFYKNGN